MRHHSILLSMIVVLSTVASARAQVEPPGTFVVNRARLALAKERVQAGDPTLMPDYNGLIQGANAVINNGPWSVMDKPYIPPSGDKHDFMHFGSYYWPNTWSPDGIPWVFRDGYVNPEAALDLAAFWDMAITTFRLAMAYYYSDHEPYAERAAYLIRYWFLEEATYMTPRFEYGGIIPGVDEDGAASLVTTAILMSYICDSIGFMQASPSWTEADQAGMLQWAEEYLLWLQTSPKVAVERERDNNHGDYHDIHPALMYYFLGDLDNARAFLETIGPERIAVQIAADGTLPNEIHRADSLTYHIIVVRCFEVLAEMGDNLGVDIWNYETEDGRGLRLTVDLLVPYLLGEEEWPYFPGEAFTPQWHVGKIIYRRAALGYWDGYYAGVMGGIQGANYWKRQVSAYPHPAPEPADRDQSWTVDFADVVALLAQWGPCEGLGCDLDGDRRITFGDLVILLSRWGRIPG